MTSQLIISLRDDVSSPAKKIERALKAAEAQVKAMAKTGMSDRLGQQITRLGLSAHQIDKVSAAWKQYATTQGLAAHSSQWTKSQAAQVRAWENATVSSVRHVVAQERRLASEQERLARQAHRIRERYGAGHMLVGAATGYVGVHNVAHGIKETVTAGARYQHERTALENVGRTPAELHEIDEASRATVKAVPTSTYEENLKVINETTGAFGSLHHAIENLTFMMKASSVLHATAGEKVHEGPGELGNKMARFFELRGTAGDSKVFQSEASEMIRAMVFSRGNFNPNEMLNFAQQAKQSLQNYDLRFLSKIAPSLVTEVGGERAGTAANAWTNTLMGKVRDKRQTAEWIRLGLLDPKMVSGGKGSPLTWKAGAVKGTDDALRDPLKWTEDVLIPAMKAKGIDTDDKLAVTKELNQLFRNSMANQWAQMITQVQNRMRLHKDEKLIGNVKEPDEIYDANLRTDPTVAIKSLTASLDNLATTVSSPAMVAAASGLSSLAAGLNALANAAKDHPLIAMGAGTAAAGGALAGAGALSYALWNGFGLKGSAVALDGSAAALTRAAAALSGGALPDGVAGPAKKPGVVRKVLGAALIGGGVIGGVVGLGAVGWTAYDNWVPPTPEREGRRVADNGKDEYDRRRRLSGSTFLNQEGAALGRRNDIWSTGANAIQHLEMSGPAASAGEKSGAAFVENLRSELDRADAMVRQKVQSWAGMLSFSARPSITPSISDPPAGQKRSDSTSLTHSRHAAFSDATNFGYV